MTKTIINLPGDVQLEVLRSNSTDFRGFGAIRIGAIPLRDASYPATIRLDTVDGIVYPRLQLREIRRSKNGGAVIRLRAVGFETGQRAYCDEYEQHLISPAVSDAIVEDDVEIHLRARRLTLGGREWCGFEYDFRFASRARQVFRLRFHGSWEIGGSVDGNIVLHQGQCNMPAYNGSRGKMFTTTCLKTLDQFGSPQGVSYQLAPRGGLLQAFDFQYAREGMLLMFWPKFESISSLIESKAGSKNLIVVDEYRFPLASRVRTTPKLVLFSAGAVQPHEARDVWFEAYDHVYGGIRKQFGLRASQIVPQAAHNKYRFVMRKDRPHLTVAGKPVPCAEWLYAFADYALPKLAKQGIRRLFPDAIHHSDVTEIGMRRKLDAGIHGDLHCASVCASHRFQPSPFWGGMKAWRYFYERGRKLGIEIGHWWSPHLSPRAPIFQQHPEYRMIGPLGLPSGGGYGHNVLNVCDWHTGIYDWMRQDIRRWKEEGGLDFLFIDSWANLGLLQQNHAARMRTNLSRLGALFRDFQRMGIASLQFEGISPFGISYFGVADLRKDRKHTLGGVVGQNDFDWWIGQEDMAINLCMVVDPRGRSEGELRRIQFRAMANRGTMLFSNLYDDRFELPRWWADLNHIYNRVQPQMQHRRLLPEGGGVRWSDGETEILWLFRRQSCAIAEHRSVQWVTSDSNGVPHRRGEPLQAWQVYRLRKP
jgi:hypothetical protein